MNITKLNFNENIEEIVNKIKSCLFVAVDTEFTGLLTDSSYKINLFDSTNEVYAKQKDNLKNVLICQLGLSIFKSNMYENLYESSTYNFYLRPHSLLNFDMSVACQTSSIEFLMQHKFDFNKWLYEGVPFINTDEIRDTQEIYQMFCKGNSVIDIPFEVYDALRSVQNWLSESPTAEDILEIPLANATQMLLFSVMLKQKHKHLVLSYDGYSCVEVHISTEAVTKGTEIEAEIEHLSEEEMALIFENVLSSIHGFNAVFDALVQHKVPLVLHNGFIDILLLYKQFYRNLPPTLNEFKTNINEMFPMIYDTKEISYVMSSIFKKQDQNILGFLSNSSLCSLKKGLDSFSWVLHTPQISHNKNTLNYSENEMQFLHEAGYDAFLTGSCFLQLAHIYAMLQLESIQRHRPLSPREHLYSLKQFCNHIPLIKSSTSYINLSGLDPPQKEHQWLVVERKGNVRPLLASAVVSSLSSFGRIDVLQRNKKSVLVTSPRIAVAKEILRSFQRDPVLKVSKYTPILHYPAFRIVTWSAALVSSALGTCLLYKSWKAS